MAIEIRMPRLVDTMTQGAVVSWRKKQGELVQAGEAIAEIEADKATVDLESPGSGTLEQILVPAGTEHVEVGRLLALLDPAGQAASAHETPTIAAAPHSPDRGNGHPPVRPTVVPVPTASAVVADLVIGQSRADATPLAASMARQAGLDLAGIRGTGPGDRVTRADVMRVAGLELPSGVEREPAPAIRPARVVSPSEFTFVDVPHSRVRHVIAERLGESKRTIPHFYLEVNCRVDGLLRVRAEVNARPDKELKLSINDFAVRAAALALRSVPEANASWTDAATRHHQRIDLAVAVATDAGLLAPVIRDADHKGLGELAAELRDLANRGRSGRLRPEELQGGTFTVSNLGMHGIDSMYAIINPPQAAILSIGAAAPRPIAHEGSVVIATMMTCTLSADHRVLDGATGARFLSVFKGYLEQPLTMIL
jgi:pyruvate dehydrogenase E2 component (dihydrolipoamide acetyltransferase)